VCTTILAVFLAVYYQQSFTRYTTSPDEGYFDFQSSSLITPFLLLQVTLGLAFYLPTLIKDLIIKKKTEEWFSVLDMISLAVRVGITLKRLLDEWFLFIFSFILISTFLALFITRPSDPPTEIPE